MNILSKKSNSTWLVALATIVISTVGVIAEDITNMKQALAAALAAALADKTVAAEGDKIKLYSASASYKPERKTWSFRFYSGGDNLHSVTVAPDGKTRYSAFAKGSSRVFDDLDFTKLPVPSEVIVEGALEKSKKALTDLGFEIIDNGKSSIYYSLTSEYREKDKPAHTFRVSLPIKHSDPKKGKQVSFYNGILDQIINTSIY